MGSGAMIYVPSFIKIGSGVQKLIGGIHTQTATWSHKPTLFFQNKESGLKTQTLSWNIGGSVHSAFVKHTPLPSSKTDTKSTITAIKLLSLGSTFLCEQNLISHLTVHAAMPESHLPELMWTKSEPQDIWSHALLMCNRIVERVLK
jgi:hypothetical protein